MFQKVNKLNTSMAEIWQLVRDVVEGEAAVKRGGVKYLPRPSEGVTEPVADRYNKYKSRAVFYGITARTLAGLTSLAFAKQPTTVLPEILERLRSNVDGEGTRLTSQAMLVLQEVLTTGRCGLLATCSTEQESWSATDIESGKFRTAVRLFKAEDIVNWRIDTVDNEDSFRTYSCERFAKSREPKCSRSSLCRSTFVTPLLRGV